MIFWIRLQQLFIINALLSAALHTQPPSLLTRLCCCAWWTQKNKTQVTAQELEAELQSLTPRSSSPVQSLRTTTSPVTTYIQSPTQKTNDAQKKPESTQTHSRQNSSDSSGWDIVDFNSLK